VKIFCLGVLGKSLVFSARQHMLSALCAIACPSVTRVDQSKTVEVSWSCNFHRTFRTEAPSI